MSTISALGSSGLQAATIINQPAQTGTPDVTAAAAPASPAAPQPTTNVQPAEQAAQPSQESVKKAAATVEKFVNAQASNQVQFSMSRDNGLDVVKVIDKSNNQVITQYPSKAIVEMAQAIDNLHGLMSTTGILHNSTA